MFQRTKRGSVSTFGKKKYSEFKKRRSPGSAQGRPSNFRSSGQRGNRGKSYQQQIDVSRFVRKASTQKKDQMYVAKHSFADFNFCELLQRNLTKRNYPAPTPIQDQAITHIMNGRDLVGISITGSGKTGAFLLPLINKIFHDKSQKLLVIAPTRELAEQIDTEFRHFSQGMNIFSALCIGGLPIYRQLGNLRQNPNVVIGTPGRLRDLSMRKAIKFESFKNIVIDEIDRMLDMGFINIITDILKEAHPKRQSLFFSATIPDPIKRLVNQFLKEYITVEIVAHQSINNIDQDIVRCHDKTLKFSMLAKILAEPKTEKVLIFNETKRDVEQLTRDLINKGFRAESLHGDKRQRERRRYLTQFRENKINILVATDVAARGLDIKDVTHVINYTIPQTYNDYIHRIGRTGRGDNKGTALTFV
ncbi:MAG TPA: ATP-dependent helicase [Candidatus Jacksonbacteria bacterium]|nr:MAG: DEAD/DEAH box helicase domain protein [Parcubacteria group bacterium GW2011_GWA2_42_28]KKT53968.1 MAG: DEAD/DEAH box helicase domain protein [Parcubacteria group bacterium GW2011_GWC2_44_22]HBH46566.1 ATP-dependent helicase [Candidatus Jacksonbacteria bacterium]HCC50112.1 ATP-dependent helicase [Candidatus Jacksonbacteria bacterium]HCE49185.1 ATP-dependent helicase [Candidatus Jacksonbacteria bacterium]